MMILYDRNMSYNYQVAHQQLMSSTKSFRRKDCPCKLNLIHHPNLSLSY
jgi:hypothetical protein